MQYRVIEISGSTRGRVAGLAALDPATALTEGATVGIVESSEKESAERRAGIRLRSRIMRLAESAGAGTTLAMMKGVKPSDLERLIVRWKGLEFTCPILGTFAVLPESDVLTHESALEMVRESAAAYVGAARALLGVDSLLDAGREVLALESGE